MLDVGKGFSEANTLVAGIVYSSPAMFLLVVTVAAATITLLYCVGVKIGKPRAVKWALLILAVMRLVAVINNLALYLGLF